MKAAILSGQPAPAMKAVVLQRPTPGHSIRLSEVPLPKVRPGWVLIKVKAFGMNHSEKILRLSEINAAYIQKPVIPGIECVGEVADPSGSGLKPGQRVAALMGGMGRSFNGSYAQYVLAPASQYFPSTLNFPGKNWPPSPKHISRPGDPFFRAETPAGRHLADQRSHLRLRSCGYSNSQSPRLQGHGHHPPGG